MSLSDYKMYPNGSLVQKLPEIGGILFGDMPEPIEKAFHPGAEGGFTYRSAVDFKLVSDFPETESEAVGVWNAFRVRKEKKISAYFGKGVAPVLFPAGLTLRSAEKVPVKNASALPISWDRIEGFYWVLTYDLVLNALRLKQNLASLAATHLLGYESPFSQEEITPVLNTFLKKAEKQSFKGVVKGASLKVYVSGNHIIGMDYHLPVMEYGKPSELLKIPDRIQYSGSQSISEVEDVPDFYFRVQDVLVVPFYMDGVAACKEGVVREGDRRANVEFGRIRILKEIQLNPIWVYIIYPILIETPSWKRFLKLLHEQAGIDLFIFQFDDDNFWYYNDKIFSYMDGVLGVTYFVENNEDFRKQKEKKNRMSYIKESDLAFSLNEGKKCLLIGLTTTLFVVIEKYKKQILDGTISVSQVKHLFICALTTIIHECMAHAAEVLINGRDIRPSEEDHYDYSGVSASQIYSLKAYIQNKSLHSTPEYRAFIEIQSCVDDYLTDLDPLWQTLEDID